MKTTSGLEAVSSSSGSGPSAGGKRGKNIDCWTLAEAIARVSARLLLDGPPGTGKSFIAARAGLAADKTPVIITCTEDMSATQLIGHFLPKGDGQWAWMDGPIIRAWREGTRLVINEIDHASGDVLTFLHAALDDPQTAALTLPNDAHEIVRPKRGFTAIATMNGDPETDLPSPLRDRFPSRVHIDSVHPQALLALPEDLRHAAATSAIIADEARRISIRKWNEFAFLRDQFKSQQDGLIMAAQAVFGHRAQEALDAMMINKASK